MFAHKPHTLIKARTAHRKIISLALSLRRSATRKEIKLLTTVCEILMSSLKLGLLRFCWLGFIKMYKCNNGQYHVLLVCTMLGNINGITVTQAGTGECNLAFSLSVLK